MPVQILNNVDLNSKKFVNNVDVFKYTFFFQSHVKNYTIMNNIYNEYSWDNNNSCT